MIESKEPRTELPAEDPVVLPGPVQGGVRGFIHDVLAWGQLRNTPYGLFPAVAMLVLSLSIQLGDRAANLLMPNIAQDLNLNVGQLLSILSIVGFVTLGGTLWLGWLADRVSRSKMLSIGGLAQGISMFFAGRAANVGSFATPLVSEAVATSASSLPVSALLADYYPPAARGRVYSLLGTLTAASGVVTVGVTAWLGTRYGWRGTLTICAVLTCAVALVCLALLREPVRGYFEKKAMGLSEESARRADPPNSFGEAWRATWKVRTVRRLFVADIFVYIASSVFGSIFTLFLADQYGLDLAHRAIIQIPQALFSLLGGFIGGGLVDALSRRSPASMLRVVSGFAVLPALAYFGFALFPPLWLLVVLGCFLGFGFSMVGPSISVFYSQVIPPSLRAQGLTVSSLAAAPGFLFLNVFGLIQSQFGYRPVMLIAAGVLVVGFVLYASAADFFEVDRRNQLLASVANEEARQQRQSGNTRVLLCKGVNVFYGDNQVLFGVDFEVDEGELVALLGTNGAGKSTLLRAISGTQEASDGAIIFDGRDITHMPPHEIAGRGVVHMPGGRGVFPGLTVDENLRLSTWLAPAQNSARLIEGVYQVFPRLAERKQAQAQLLSGGEQQMLALAQAFMVRPRLLMIDELSLGLSPAIVGELLEKVKEINARGTTVIVVEQSVNVALSLAKRAVFMEKGEVKFAGPTAELLRRPDILRAVYVKGTGAMVTTGDSGVPSQRRRREEQLRQSQAVLEVKNVSKSFGGVQALRDVSLTLREGEILGLIGPNGSGKTTLYDIISGYQSPDSGSVVYQGVDVTGLPAYQRARLRMVRRFQDARLVPSLTVYETLLVALDQRMEVRNAALHLLQLPSARRAERRAQVRAERLIEILQLGAYRDKFIKELSTGLRRIVDLAFVLATEPQVLLLDEPSTGIAQAEAESLGPLLTRVRHETGCAILIIEHDMPLISAVSDELIAMVTGEVVTRGSAEAVLNDQRVVEAFLGGSEAAVHRSGSLAN